MPTKRQARFLDAVTRAAQEARVRAPSGRPTLANLTSEGRAKGFAAMKSARRCRSLTRDGRPCRCPAMKGATRCVKHGGRYEVPDHPHNLRRFMAGKMHDDFMRQAEIETGRDAWETMSRADRSAVMEALPPELRDRANVLYRAAGAFVRSMKEPAGRGHRIWADAIRRLSLIA